MEPSNGFVLRRPMSGDVIVGSYHVMLGPVFWECFRDPNQIAYYGLTFDVDRAHRFESDSMDKDALLSQILESYADLDPGSDFEQVGKRTGVSRTEFVEWIANTVWLEVRVCTVPVFLCRLQGRIDRSSECTRDLSCAHRFSPSTALFGKDLDAIRLHGRLVPATAAREVARMARQKRMVRWEDRDLAAHAAWSEWKLSLRFGLADVKARRLALEHAGMAGWEIASSRCGRYERHFSSSAELAQAFELGRAFHRAVSLKLTSS